MYQTQSEILREGLRLLKVKEEMMQMETSRVE